MKQESVLVTGGTGFIGLHLVKRLIKEGYNVRVLTRKESANIYKLENLNVEIAHGDICDLSTLDKAFEDIHTVFHCAAHVSDWGSKEEFEKTNVQGTKNVLNSCVNAHVKLFVGLSTNDVMGRIQDKIVDESMELKEWREPYPDSKIKAERLIWQFYREHNLPVTVTYPCWVYGEEDTTFLPHLIEAIEDGSFLYWKKNAAFYPTYIDNLIDLLLLMSKDKNAIGNGYLVHDGHSVTLKDFCNKISLSLNLKKVKLSIPYPLALFAAMMMQNIWKILALKSRPLLTTYIVKNFGSNIKYSIAKAENELNWTPRFSFEEGFKRTMDWIKNPKNKPM